MRLRNGARPNWKPNCGACSIPPIRPRASSAGCTTNPPLSLEAVKSDPKFWNARIDEIVQANPGITPRELFWETHKLVVKKGAEAFRAMNEASGGRFGWVSGQLDPRLFSEKEAMYWRDRRVDRLAAQSDDQSAGQYGRCGRGAASHLQGISTNFTNCFTVSQVLAVARAAC